jgi:phage tail sheath protein FI
MPEYLSPGVYVEEIDAGPKPIEGVSTSTAGAIGVTALGPTSGKPVLVTSFTDFVRTFGGFRKDPDSGTVNKWSDEAEGGHWWQFPLSVKGFFDNGGQRLYVKRVFAKSAVASFGKLGQGLINELAGDVAAGSTAVKLRHLINVFQGVPVKLFRGDDGSAIDGGTAFTVAAFDEDGRSITLNTAPTKPLVAKRGDYLEIHPRVAPGTANSVIFTAKSKGIWGDDLNVRLRPMIGSVYNVIGDPGLAANAAASTKVVSTTNSAGPKTTVKVDAIAGFADGDHILVNGREFAISNLTAPDTFEITPPLTGTQSWTAGTIVKRLLKANDTGGGGGKTINLWGPATLYKGAVVELSNGKDKETSVVADVAGSTVTLADKLTKPYFEGHKLRVVEAEVTVRYAPDNVAQAEEVFSNLRLVADGSLSSLVNHIKQRSELIEVSEGPDFNATNLTKFPLASSGIWEPLANGDDKLGDLSPDDFVGEDLGSNKRTGVQAFEDIDEISICLAPGMWSSTIHSALIIHSETLKDRFVILDPPPGLSNEDIRSFREPLDTKYAALYYPWIEVRDPLARQNVQLAPSAHLAGIYARVDVERGVHKAPANEVIRGITKIADDVTKREQDTLNPRNINVLRFFPGRGNRVWGARVVTSDAAWKYINVRRLFIFVEESIDEGTQWVVFEPNDEPLWARVRATITNFLTTVWRNGALQGLKPDEAFFVRCDRTTMTQDDIDNGRLICLIGIAPVKPAEFVIFRIQQKTLDNKVG